MEEKRKKEKAVEASIIADYKRRDKIFNDSKNSTKKTSQRPSSNCSYSYAPNSNV